MCLGIIYHFPNTHQGTNSTVLVSFNPLFLPPSPVQKKKKKKVGKTLKLYKGGSVFNAEIVHYPKNPSPLSTLCTSENMIYG